MAQKNEKLSFLGGVLCIVPVVVVVDTTLSSSVVLRPRGCYRSNQGSTLNNARTYAPSHTYKKKTYSRTQGTAVGKQPPGGSAVTFDMSSNISYPPAGTLSSSSLAHRGD